MYDFLSMILSPIVWAMGKILELFIQLTGSPGISVILLALFFTTILIPIQKYGRRVEERVRVKMKNVNDELAPYKGKLKGEALFNQTEQIYKKHAYHPIHSVGLGMSFVVLLPILISAILLLGSHPQLQGQSFLIVSDLSKPDSLLSPINILPVFMTGITLVEAFIRFKDDKPVLYRFIFIAVVLFALVYNLASALVIYWTTNVSLSLLLTLKERKNAAKA
ncbi:MAG: hypothetical protein HKO02_03745 [Hyphomonadaceae bacterium]|nr:hypothetical protein [Hyphomonadaceae bacterium]